MRKMILGLLTAGMVCVGQAPAQDRMFGKKELEADLAYLQQQLRDVHADPTRELAQGQWTNLFAGMRKQLKDSMTTAAFFSIIKPAVAYLSDEHAEITAPAYYGKAPVFLPFSLRSTGSGFVVDTVLEGSALRRGDKVIKVNGIAVAQLVKELGSFTTGFAEERKEKTPEQFGYLYGIAHPYGEKFSVTLEGNKDITLTPTTLARWTALLKAMYGAERDPRKLGYEKHGDIGYLIVPHFAVNRETGLNEWKRTIDSIFTLADQDGVTRFVIDVSRNSGGNSAVGRLLIDHFYSSPYQTYQMGWRRSDDYLKLMKSWGGSDSDYETLAPGATLRRSGGKEMPSENTPKFKGKVYVVIGNGTFSSAIMFATIVKDNKMATLIGRTPRLGHPTHFGEMYSTRLPNTQLALRFGVKEWIRPRGKNVENVLTPDILLEEVTPETVIQKISK